MDKRCYIYSSDMDARYRAVRVILYVISRFGMRGVERTRLMKLLFLIDRVLRNRAGIALFRWIMWKYGPFSKDVLDILDDLEVDNVVKVRRGVGYVIYIHETPIELHDPELENLINEIVDRYGNVRLEELLDYVYKLPEVRDKLPGQRIW